MAITMTDKDGSVQNFDTYAEFEQAMVLMSRIGGNKVPQDLLDEVKSKYGAKEPKPLQVKIDGTKFETAISEATRELAEETAEEAPRKVVALRDGLDVTGGREYTVVGEDTGSDRLVNIIDDAGDKQSMILGNEAEYVSDTEGSPTEFRTGDIVRATEDVVGFGGNYYTYNAGELLEVQTGGSGAICLVKDSWKGAYVSENLDNIELVCRKEDRKDIGL